MPSAAGPWAAREHRQKPERLASVPDRPTSPQEEVQEATVSVPLGLPAGLKLVREAGEPPAEAEPLAWVEQVAALV